MIAHILELLSQWITHVILTLGYGGVVLLMAIESACIPLPSEIIMPFAGAVTVGTVAASLGAEPWSRKRFETSGAGRRLTRSAKTAATRSELCARARGSPSLPYSR